MPAKQLTSCVIFFTMTALTCLSPVAISQDNVSDRVTDQAKPKKKRTLRDKEKWLDHSGRRDSLQKKKRKRIKRKYYD